MYPGPEEGPIMTEFVTAVVICGTIVVFLMEFIKRTWKKRFEKFPSWLGLYSGAFFSAVASMAYCLGWFPDRSEGKWLLVWIATFLYQYFVSMEIAKRVVNAVVRRIAGAGLEG